VALWTLGLSSQEWGGDFHYKGDIALLEGSPQGLQSLITATDEGLHAVHLHLSVPKCPGMVLGLTRLDVESITPPIMCRNRDFINGYSGGRAIPGAHI
jgi:hypothetical protein